tara:strand:+ start:409 stop:780 length:372 start_codon:yes stop_codon:yes gene_type:complete
MFHFPLHVLSPRLLSNRAASTSTFDHLEGGEIVGVIFDGDEGSGMQEFHHVERAGPVPWLLLGGHNRVAVRIDPQGVVWVPGRTTQVCSDFASAFMKKWLVNADWICICSLWAWLHRASRPSD